MKKLILFSIIFNLLWLSEFSPQSNGNIPLMCKTKFNRDEGSGDVWGVNINNINYALVTLDGGLSIVNTDNPYSPVESAHINHDNYATGSKLEVPDVETFTYNGTTYAYLATNNGTNTENIIVVVINLNKAITDGGLILIDPETDTPSPTEVFAGRIYDSGNINRSHTLTIAGGYLYAATLNQYIPVWDLNQNPTSPPYLGSVYINNPAVQVHEMFVKPVNSLNATIYAACVLGGLQVVNISFIPTKGSPPTGLIVNNITQHLYDFDRAFPNKRISEDNYFDYRVTHSAWPTDNEQYIFTTDEFHLDGSNPPPVTQYSSGDPNLYSTPDPDLRSPRREGAFLRTWKKSLLGTDNSYKGGYYVSEQRPKGITDLSQIDTNWIPNNIHQMYIKGNRMYVAHYTQGFRYLDISDPENIIELGYYDDFPSISFNPSSDYFFRKNGNWHKGIYGVFRDPVRTTICYAGGSDGFYIFDMTAIPYPPTNLAITPNGQGHYVLSWTPSQSLNAQKYYIYRAAVPCCEPYDLPLYDSLNAYQGGNPVTSWEDVNSRTGSGDGMYYYEISMKNTVGKNSVHSNRVGVGIGQPTKRTAEDETKEKPNQFDYSLSSNFPNPFNPSTTINYSLKENGFVTVKVYNVLGKEVQTLINEQEEAGSYSVDFNASELTSGIYFYTIQSGNFSASKKMILLK